MVHFTKNGRIVWSKEEQDSLLIYYKENSDPSLTDRAKLAKQLGVPVKKVTGWFNHQKIKMKRKLKLPNFLKKKKPQTKLKIEKIPNVEESHIGADVDFKEPVANTPIKPRSIKLRKYSKEKTTKREVFRIIQPKFKRDRPKPSIDAPSKLESNTDINFLDSKPSKNLLSEQEVHDAIDRFVNADFSESDNEDFHEDPTLLDDMSLTDKSLDVSFFESGKLNNAFIEQAVDYSNIQNLISCTSPPPQDMTLNTFLNDFNSDLEKSAEVEEILDLHVQMIADYDLDDDNEDLNAFHPVY